MMTPRTYYPCAFIKRLVFGFIAFVILVGFPGPMVLSSSVSAATANAPQCTPVVPADNGTSKPTGAAAATFTYNKCTGLYENNHYNYNPATRQYTAKDPAVYVCNTNTWMWQNTNHWSYVTSAGKYEQDTVNANPPTSTVNGQTCQPPTPVAAPESQTPGNAPGASSGRDDSSSSTDSNNTNINQLNNSVSATATSGNVNVIGNTVVGDATSGNTSSSAVIINQLGALYGVNLGSAVTFTKNIDGDVNGDIIINPSTLQPASANVNNANNTSLHTSTSNEINNTINLAAQSGNVNVAKNTKAGDATSGNASAMANVVNMLNTYVSAKQSFIGTININGSLNGDILMPPKFLDSLAASGAPKAVVHLDTNNAGSITNNSVTNIVNQINSQAASGQVTADQNTQAGNATSGDATTSVVIYNLTGQKIIGNNGLLVFVNVMGKWVGVITGAPGGASAAMLGGVASVNDNFAISNTTNNKINNNITVSARSGNVNASQNTMVGNATSGDATTGVSVANYSNDYLDYTGWFGLLFINVFGTWNGNFGVASLPISLSGGASHRDTKSATTQPVFRFVPKKATHSFAATSLGTNTADNSKTGVYQLASVLRPSAQVLAEQTNKIPAKDMHNTNNNNSITLYIVAASLVALGAAMLLTQRKSTKS